MTRKSVVTVVRHRQVPTSIITIWEISTKVKTIIHESEKQENLLNHEKAIEQLIYFLSCYENESVRFLKTTFHFPPHAFDVDAHNATRKKPQIFKDFYFSPSFELVGLLDYISRNVKSGLIFNFEVSEFISTES